MHLIILLFLFITVCLRVALSVKFHYSELLQHPDQAKIEEQQSVKRKRPRNDSHKFLNRKAKKKEGNLNEERYITKELDLGHTGRDKFVPLMKQRDRNEETVNHAMVAGIILRKSNPGVSHPLFDYAHSTRLNSQKVQKKMNEIKNGGSIDRKQIQIDLNKLHKADEEEKIEKQKQKARKENAYQNYRSRIYKNRFRGRFY